MAYDDDNFGAPQVIHLHINEAGVVNAANEVMARLKFFTRVKILECRAIIVSTAYDEADCAYNIYKDDGSIGAVTLSTATVNQVLDASLTDTVFETTNTMEIQQASETSTGLCDFLISYQELFG